MSKITKKPKRVQIFKQQVIEYEFIYTCPSCHSIYGGFVNDNTRRFVCVCGQELIISKFTKVPLVLKETESNGEK